MKLGSEFMPTLNEGTLFYMPTALPGMSVTKAAELLQTQNKIIKSFPEVASVYGKAGRAQTATDPAPLEMFETVINLKPQEDWRPGMDTDKLIAEMDKALQFPGVANSWTMPIKARIDMLSTGIRTPIGIKVFGKNLDEMESLAKQIESVVKKIPGTSSAYAERITGGYYLNIEPDRLALARYGLTVGEVQDVIATALGGETVTTTVEGLERFGVNVRYPRDLRSTPEQIAREVLVPTPMSNGQNGAMIPLGQIAKVSISKGAPSIRTENSLLSAYIYVDIRDRDIGSYVAEARKAVADQVKFPPGYYATWSGQFEYMERAAAKMKIVIPITLLVIFLLLYLNFKRVTESLVVMLSVPFALVGGVWLLWLLDYNLSVAVAVGFIALAGVAAETGRGDADLSGARMAGRPDTLRQRRTPADSSRSPGSHHARRGGTRTPEDDDRSGDHGGPVAHPVEQRHRLGSNAPHRRPHGRRHDLFSGAHVAGDPGHLRAAQTTLACFCLQGCNRTSATFTTPANKGIAMKTLTLLLSMTLASGSGMAQAAGLAHDMSQHEMATMAAANTSGPTGVGVIRAVNETASKVQIAHEPIAGLNWPAMTMWFELQKPLPANLKVGDRVLFELTQNLNNKWVITRIESKR